jgi:ubiquinone/menaquinone biosynthesis C-methylase UbiE
MAPGFDTRALRERRYRRLARLVCLKPEDRILELGCGRGERSIAAFNPTNEITGLDLLDPAEVRSPGPNFRYRRGDATDLSQFPDRAFDVVVAVGLLEHIRPREKLVAAIREAQRVADRYGFVVPHRYAFVEPHFRMPLFSIWPDALKAFAIRRRRLGTQPRNERGEWQQINWLPAAEWRTLFDDPTFRVERFWYGPLLQYYLLAGGRCRYVVRGARGAR